MDMRSTRKMPYREVPLHNGAPESTSEDEEGFMVVDEWENIDDLLKEGRSPIWKAMANLLSDIEGTGLLGIPFALLKGGWVALGALVVVPFIACYTGKILIECLYDTKKDGRKVRVRENFKEIASEIWPTFGVCIVVATQLISFCLIASLYLVLASDLIGAALPNIKITHRQWMVIAALAGLPTTFFKTLSQVAWLSLISVIALMIAVALVIGYGITHRSAWVFNYNIMPPFDIEGVPLALAIIIFSYAAHVALPSLEASLRDRSQYNKIICSVYMFTFVLKLVFGGIAFITFRSNITEVITTSIPMSSFYIAIAALLCTNVMFSYPFRIIALVRTLEDSVIPEKVRSAFPDLVWYIGIRVLLNFITLLPAVLIPQFALMMAFLGSLVAAMSAFVYPCVFHLFLKYNELSRWEIAIDLVLVVFGFTASALGLLATGRRVFDAYTT